MLRYVIRSSSRRHAASSRRFYGEAPAASSPPEASSAPLIVSRRVWRQIHPPPKPTPKKKTVSEEDNKPWPRSVVYGGTGVALILIPYIGGWMLSSSTEWRERLLTREQLVHLRRWYGSLDHHENPFPDQQQMSELPRRLPGELSERLRLREEGIEEMLSHQSVTVKLTPIDSNEHIISGLEQTMKLPASRLARHSDLSKLLPSEASQVASVAVDLVSTDDETDPTSVEDESAVGSSSELAAIASNQDPLVSETHTYSTWYYQSTQPTATHVTERITNEEFQIQQLQADLERLELELQNSRRPIDDVMDDIHATKARLRRLQWNKWLPWT